jgi:hypothetical protein
MRGGGNDSNQPDTTDPVGRKFRRACDIVEQQYDDRWPARDTTGKRSHEWPPLEDVSRAGRLTEYRKRPNAR